jgi:hypothetical protein
VALQAAVGGPDPSQRGEVIAGLPRHQRPRQIVGYDPREDARVLYPEDNHENTSPLLRRLQMCIFGLTERETYNQRLRNLALLTAVSKGAFRDTELDRLLEGRTVMMDDATHNQLEELRQLIAIDFSAMPSPLAVALDMDKHFKLAKAALAQQSAVESGAKNVS